MPARKLALVLAGFCSAAGAAPSLYVTTEMPLTVDATAYTPYTTVEWVRQVASRAGIPYTLTQYPWKRAYAIAMARPDGCVFVTARTPEREALFKWVGPVNESEWMLVGWVGRDYQVRTLEDARKYRIGTYNGDARDQYLRSRGFNVDPAETDRANAKKLRLGRIDLWASTVPRGRQAAYPDYFPDTIVPILKFHTVTNYLACNRAVPDTVIARLNEAAAEWNSAAAAAASRPDSVTRLDDSGRPGP